MIMCAPHLTILVLLHFAITSFCSSAQEITTIRILPLGDSITWGYGSNTTSGYRLPLLTLLTTPPSPFSPPATNITYIGTLTSGTLPPPNNANEGHVGATITSIASFAEVPLSWNGTKSGNVVLLMAGTNDMSNSTMAAAAPAQLGSLIDEIVAAWPQAAVLVASLTPFVNNVSEANVLIFNPTIPGIVSERAAAGKRVLFVSMANVTVGELYDGLHPDDAGYAVMAQAWYAGLLVAREKGWVQGVTNGTSTGVKSAGPSKEMVGWIIGFMVVSLGFVFGG